MSGTLGTSLADEQVIATGMTSTFAGGDYGVVARYTNSSNWYKAYIDGSNLIIRRNFNGSNIAIASVPFVSQANIPYTIRFQAIGTWLLAKVWATSASEPANWMATANDASLVSGYCGVRATMQNGTTATYASFLASSL